MDPKTRYTVAVSTALLGASVVAFGAGSALPKPGPDTASATLSGSSLTGHQADVTVPQTTSTPTASTSSNPNQGRAAVLVSDGVQRRLAAPIPEKLPDWVRPADGYISSTFGLRFGGAEFHKGLDIAGPVGSPIRAAAAGKVIISESEGGYGNLVAIDHGRGVVTYYGHNSALIAEVGEEVQPGDVIAKRGSTGQSSGPHCHFEVRVAGVRIDPMPWLRTHGVRI
ncbi:MAG: M23 family metallopeptidase [Mycobacteriales bacterium]